MPDHTILIVDYEPKMVESARTILEKAGFQVVTATDGLSGIEAFHKVKPALTLIEFMLPKKSGLEVCRELRNSPDGQSAALVITGSRFRSRQYRTEARHTYKADDFVEKPISEETLLSLVQTLVTERQPVAVTAAPVQAPANIAPGPAATPSAPDESSADVEAEIGDRLDSLFGDL